jgi:hypothetical protein
MHQPLLKALSTFRQGQLLAGTRLFHGSLDRTNGASDRFHPLSGSRKWLSERSVLAGTYAFDGESNDNGVTHVPADRYLWICEVITNVPALIGIQYDISKIGPWQDWEFPHKFPDEFDKYANTFLGASSSYALIDFMDKEFMSQVLVTNPSNALRVLERIDLPESRSEADKYLEARFPDAI